MIPKRRPLKILRCWPSFQYWDEGVFFVCVLAPESYHPRMVDMNTIDPSHCVVRSINRFLIEKKSDIGDITTLFIKTEPRVPLSILGTVTVTESNIGGNPILKNRRLILRTIWDSKAPSNVVREGIDLGFRNIEHITYESTKGGGITYHAKTLEKAQRLPSRLLRFKTDFGWHLGRLSVMGPPGLDNIGRIWGMTQWSIRGSKSRQWVDGCMKRLEDSFSGGHPVLDYPPSDHWTTNRFLSVNFILSNRPCDEVSDCPVITTFNPNSYAGLVPGEEKNKIAAYHSIRLAADLWLIAVISIFSGVPKNKVVFEVMPVRSSSRR